MRYGSFFEAFNAYFGTDIPTDGRASEALSDALIALAPGEGQAAITVQRFHSAFERRFGVKVEVTNVWGFTDMQRVIEDRLAAQ